MHAIRNSISARGAELLAIATGHDFAEGDRYQYIRDVLHQEGQNTQRLRNYFGVASSGECRYIASLLAAMGCATLLSVKIDDKVVIGDVVNGGGLDDDLQEDVVCAWLTSKWG